MFCNTPRSFIFLLLFANKSRYSVAHFAPSMSRISTIHYILFLLVVAWRVRGQTENVDDTNVGMFYTGLWIPDGDPNTFGHHDTWTNQSGASVSFDFIGTQIRVFVTRRPSGTYLSKASFSVDGGAPTIWETSDPVLEISYRNLVYTSDTLAPIQHRITVTNLGQIFWLDYMEYTIAIEASFATSTRSLTDVVTTTIIETTSLTAVTSLRTISHPPPLLTTSWPGAPIPAHAFGTSDHQPLPSISSRLWEESGSSSASGFSFSFSLSTSFTSPNKTCTLPSNTTAVSSSSTAPPTTTSSTLYNPAGPAITNSTPPGLNAYPRLLVSIVLSVLAGIGFLLLALWWLRMRSKARKQSAWALSAVPYSTSYASRIGCYVLLTRQSYGGSIYVWLLSERSPT
ncbi:hypothetical protein C8Q79DRAFT_334923 [Trametes meyenii]|nr:hypothetical protein C8Q79DRAFT_334923 [Trametes meyenii]